MLRHRGRASGVRGGRRGSGELIPPATRGLASDEREQFATADCCFVTGDLPLLGFGLPVSGRWATPDTIRRTARRAEALGYASLWSFQRVLYPADGGLGPAHGSVLNPVVPLAYVAGHTDRIGWGRRPSARRSQLPRCSRRH
jgi:hypothetical protein